MIKIDLITGFLGAGKTTFLKKYARFLLDKGERICIIENDFGAINVDLVLLKELECDNCNLEMVVGGDGAEAHKRRLKTKLIAMAMMGYDRVIIEPSGIYDVDEFFDLLYEEPLDNWYEAGNVIAIVNAKQDRNLSPSSRYVLMSEVAHAGAVILSRSLEATAEEKRETLEYLDAIMREFDCSVSTDKKLVIDSLDEGGDKSALSSIVESGYNNANYVKKSINADQNYQTLFYFDFEMDIEDLKENTSKVFQDDQCGNVHRIKGIVKDSSGATFEINITQSEIMTNPVDENRAVLIVIGENLQKENIAKYLGESTI